jgi:hypothetical protein
MMDDVNPRHLDVSTIRFLQGRCPALSTSDWEAIESQMEENQIFPNVIDQQERARLKQRLLDLRITQYKPNPTRVTLG